MHVQVGAVSTVFASLVKIEVRLFLHLYDKQNEQSNSVILCQ